MKSFIFFPNSRKASSDMWWIIIGAVIALVVMIVLMIMFTGKSNILEKGLLDCSGKGGTCLSEEACKLGKGTITRAFTCPGEDVCCFEKDCSGKGGTCLSEDTCGSSGGTIAQAFICPGEEVCCLEKKKKDSDQDKLE